jgi:hypothetical protein
MPIASGPVGWLGQPRRQSQNDEGPAGMEKPKKKPRGNSGGSGALSLEICKVLSDCPPSHPWECAATVLPGGGAGADKERPQARGLYSAPIISRGGTAGRLQNFT